MTQTWHDLLFAHWAVAPDVVRPLVPAELELDLRDGRAWIGVVPFRMTNVGPRGANRLPLMSEFAELNVRTYVRVGDRPGVWFFSLDAASALAVRAARLLLNLPYYTADMQVRTGERIEYESRRLGSAKGSFAATYAPEGPAFEPLPGSLEHFLVERYCLYNRHHGGSPYRLDIHHAPWALQPARALISRNAVGEAGGLVLPADAPLLHFARRQDVVAWLPIPVDARSHSRTPRK
jgi:uncharacterized protein YqjF (DUF2071 family)